MCVRVGVYVLGWTFMYVLGWAFMYVCRVNIHVCALGWAFMYVC